MIVILNYSNYQYVGPTIEFHASHSRMYVGRYPGNPDTQIKGLFYQDSQARQDC